MAVEQQRETIGVVLPNLILSPREAQIARLLQGGADLKAIAAEIAIKPSYVNAAMGRIKATMVREGLYEDVGNQGRRTNKMMQALQNVNIISRDSRGANLSVAERALLLVAASIHVDQASSLLGITSQSMRAEVERVLERLE